MSDGTACTMLAKTCLFNVIKKLVLALEINITIRRINLSVLLAKAPPNKHGVYMIYNKPPAAWSGRKLNIGLYKDEKVLIVKRDLRVGDYVELKPTNKLYFCCMESASPTSPRFDINAVFTNARSVNRGDSIDFFDAEFTPLTKIDLHQYPNGMEVIVQENEMSGQILFIPKPHYS